MNKIHRSWHLLTVATIALTIGACSSGSSGGSSTPGNSSNIDTSGATTPADLSTPDKAASASGAVASLTAKLGGGGSGSGGFTAKSHPNTEQDCDSGSVTESDRPDGSIRLNFNQCVVEYSDSTESYRTFENGIIDFDFTFTPSDFSTSADFGADGRDFRSDYRSPFPGTAVENTSSYLLGTIDATGDNQGITTTVVLDLRGNIRDLISGDQYDFLADLLTIDSVDNQNGTLTVDINGGLGTSARSAQANCGTGRVDIQTINSLTIDESSETIQSGQLQLTAGSATATVTFEGDFVTVDVGDGSPMTYTQAEFQQFCNI